MVNEFETLINRFIKNIIQKGYGFGWKNHSLRTQSGVFVEGEPFDFCLILKNGKILVFDAKAIHTKSWKLQQKDINQCNNMLKCLMNKYCKGFFIVYFYNHNKYRIIDAVDVANIVVQNRKTVKYEEMEEIKLEDLIK